MNVSEDTRQRHASSIRSQHGQVLLKTGSAVRTAGAGAFRRIVDGWGRRRTEARRKRLSLSRTPGGYCDGSSLLRDGGQESAKDQIPIGQLVDFVATREAARIHPDLMNVRRNALERFFNLETDERRLV